MVTEVPLGIVAVHIECAERRGTVAYGYQHQLLVGSGYFLGHDPIGAVCQLIDSPLLFGRSCKLGD